MEQLSFFAEAGQSTGLPLDMLDYHPGVFTSSESAYLAEKFITETHWVQPIQKLYDKEVITPRLTAWYGDAADDALARKLPGISQLTDELLMIKNKVETLACMQFNCVLLNHYRDGNDSVAWHSDKGTAHGRQTVVASVSFGQVRSFDIRNKYNHAEKYSIKLENGSYLLMKAGFQEGWEHRIAKSTKPMKARLNLTFRVIG